jgi:hypothetical protein
MTHASTYRRPGEGRLARLRRLRRDARGLAATEFAFVAPIFILMLMGIFDQGFAMYIQAALHGATQEGARQASLENTLFSDIEAKVNRQVRNVVPTSDPNTEITFTLDPTYYQNYNEIELPEDFEDKTRAGVKDGIYQLDEWYVDRNGNNQRDTDVGLAGRGGAQDVVSIKASLTYRRIFPFWSLIGQPQNQVLSATTFLRNQPFSAQATRVGVRKCKTTC